MKKAFSQLICNDRLAEIISLQIREDKLSHAYILAGAKGMGKHTAARLISAAIECERRYDENSPLPCGICPSCDKILSGNATDVTYISKEDKATVGVDKIRDLQSDVYVSATEQKNKIYIIEEAHLMTAQAQNALLKVLEEPPKNVVFLLLSENNAALLETIKSRAQTFFMDPVPKDEMERYLKENSKKAHTLAESSPDALSEIIISSAGSIGTALSFLDTKAQKQLLSRRGSVKKFIELCRDRRSKAALVPFLSSLPQKRDELSEIFSLALLALRDIAVCKRSSDAPTCFFASRGEAEQLAQAFSLSWVFIISDALSAARDSLAANANVQITLANLLCELQKR